jgi:molybdate-binding protein/DNA-binding XRE family transcriptional regulator
MSSIGARLAAARKLRAIGQSQLARDAGISRQALSALEAGTYQPGVATALRLARALGCSVEELFEDPEPQSLEARVTAPHRAGRAPVALARVAGRLVAAPLPAAALCLTPGSGIADLKSSGEAHVEAFRSSTQIDSTLLIAGCDPGVSMLRDFLARNSPPIEVVAIRCSSGSALELVAAKKAHVAGIHLRDRKTGEYNLQAARAAMGRERFSLINFARWELGMACRHRSGIRKLQDVVDGRTQFINREPGSGARQAIEDALREGGISTTRLAGYRTIANGHLEVASAIAIGHADAGLTIRIAAEAYELDFYRWSEERYDLVVPQRERQSTAVRALLDAVSSSYFARQVGAFCGYATDQMGNACPSSPSSK